MTASSQFTRLTLRTTDVTAARAFYSAVLGHDASEIVPLHEQAIARGARPHWLGQIAVDDVDRVVAAFEAWGATRMGPTATRPDGRSFTVVRDPGGAVVGLVTRGDDEPSRVVWHQLNTTALAAVCDAYTAVFGFRIEGARTNEHGVFLPFSWADREGEVGAITDVTHLPGRHAHWLFQWPVRDLDGAIAEVRARKGVVLGPFAWPSGDRVAVCDDAQGAAFALRGP